MTNTLLKSPITREQAAEMDFQTIYEWTIYCLQRADDPVCKESLVSLCYEFARGFFEVDCMSNPFDDYSKPDPDCFCDPAIRDACCN